MKTTIHTIRIAVLAAACCILTHGAYSQANQPGSGNCLQFDGVNDYVDVGDKADFQFGTGDFTIECWFYFDGNAQAGGLVSKRNPVPPWQQFTLYIGGPVYTSSSGKKLSAFFRPDGGALNGSEDRFMQIELSVAKWYHVTVVNNYDSVAEMFLDGIRVGTNVTNYANKTLSINGYPLQIGAGNTTGSLFYKGLIDEVRIWNYARSQTEIREDMCKKLAGNEPGLVGYWRMDEGSGSTAFDSSPNANDGTLY